MIYADVPIPKPPYFKGKGFLDKLIPIIRKGIPKEADSRRDPKVIGTAAWESFWTEEIYKIINGVWCPGVGWVPGRFYYYMNYKVMSTILGVITPDMVDLYLELAYFIEYCKRHGINILCPKARRKGISEAATTMLTDYDFRFVPGSQCGVASGKKTYVDDFVTKWRYSDSCLPPELSIKKLTDNDDEIIAGYNMKNEFGAWEEKGTKSAILCRTMHTNPNMFKGLFLNSIVSEEIGEHEKWFEFFSATKDCLMGDNRQVGIMMAFGTGNKVNKGSKDFKMISEKAEYYNFIELVIDARRAMYYGGAKEANKELPLETALFKSHQPHQLIGVEDLFLAEKEILRRRETKLKAGNIKEYNEELQNNPLNKSEIFKKTNANNFNMDKINAHLHKISISPHKEYTRYILEWEKDDKGLRKIPLKVKPRPALPQDPEENSVYIVDAEHPRKGYKNLYCGAVDSYDQNSSMTKSLGGMEVMIRENTIPLAMKKNAVAIIRTRPPRKEKFYEMCLQLAVYYDLIGNVLGDVRCPGILQFWKDWGGDKYIAQRPAKFESPNTEAGHDYWMSINRYSKPLMVGVMESHVEDYIDGYKFPALLNEIGDYDIETVDSDNDLADAHGMCLIQDMCCELKPKDTTKEDEYSDIINLPEFGENGNFIIEKPDLESEEQDWQGFGQR